MSSFFSPEIDQSFDRVQLAELLRFRETFRSRGAPAYAQSFQSKKKKRLEIVKKIYK